MSLLARSSISVLDVADGNGMTSVSITYAIGSSPTVPPGSPLTDNGVIVVDMNNVPLTDASWYTTIPVVPQGYYLWTRTITTYLNGEFSIAYVVGYTGTDGSQGEQGVSITNQKEQWYLSNSSSSLSGGSWSYTEPSEIPDGKYLFGRWEFTMSDGTTKYSDAIYKSMIGGLINLSDEMNKKITQKIWQSDISTSISSYDGTTAQSIRDRVSQTESDISGITSTVSDVQSTLSTKADSSTVTALSNTVSQNEQTASAFRQTVQSTYATLTNVDNKIKDMKISGHNLYIIADQVNGNLSSDHSGSIVSPNATRKEVTSVYIPVKSGEKYIIQSWCTPTNAGDSWLAYQFFTDNSGTVCGNRSSKYGSTTNSGVEITADGQEHLTYEVEVPANANYLRVSYRRFNDGKCMVEKATKPSEYAINPQDLEQYADSAVATAKSEIKQTTDAISLQVSSKVGASEIISKINQSAENITIDASKVDLVGNVTFSMLDNSTQTAITNAQSTANSAMDAFDGIKVYTGTQTGGNASDTEKIITCSDNTFSYQNDIRIKITFGQNTCAAPTININNLGAKQIIYNYNMLSSSNPLYFNNGLTATFQCLYGMYWQLIDIDETTLSTTKLFYCSTAAATAEKSISSNNMRLLVKEGTSIDVYFAFANTANAPTLKLDGIPAFPVKYKNQETSSSNPYKWDANTTVSFTFQNSYWCVVDGGSQIVKDYASSAVGWVSTNGTSVVTAKDIIANWATDATSTTTTIQGGLIEAHTIVSEKLATDAIMSNNYVSGQTGSPFSGAGTFLDLATGNIYMPNFGVNAQTGAAFFNGEIVADSGSIGSDNTNYWSIGTITDYDGNDSAAIVGHGTSYIQSGKWMISEDRIDTRWYVEGVTAAPSLTYLSNTVDGDTTYWDYGMSIPNFSSNQNYEKDFLYIRYHEDTIPTVESDWVYPFRVTHDGKIYATDFIITGDGSGSTYLPLTGGTVTGNLTVTGTFTMPARQLNVNLATTTNEGKVSFTGAGNATLGVKGTLGVGNGGTGTTTFTSGAVLIGNGSSAIQTRSIKNMTAAGNLGWTAVGTDNTIVTTNTLAYWNGRYNASDSNLEYVKLGKLGTIVTHDATEYLSTTGGTVDGSLSVTELTAGNLVVTGSGRFTNGLYGDLTGNVVGIASQATQLQNSRTILTNLGTNASASFNGTANVSPGVTGTLGVGNGGTGQTTAVNACNTFLNALSTGSNTPVDNDYYISQYVNGGTTTTTYHRRPMSKLWDYISGKITASSFAATEITPTNISSGDLNECYTTLKTIFYYGAGSNNTKNNPLNSNTTPETNTGIQFGAFTYASAAGNVAQELSGYKTTTNNGKFIRWRDGSNWTSWQKFITDYNYTDYTVTKTGTGASGTWGISISGTATKATQDGGGNVIEDTYLKLSGGTLTGNLYITNSSSISDNVPARLYLGVKQTDNNITSYGYIAAYDDHDTVANGVNMVIHSAGNLFVGSGESGNNLYNAAYLNNTSENLYLSSDSGIYFFVKCNTISERQYIQLNTEKQLFPNTTNTGSLGTSDKKWNGVYATTLHGNLDSRTITIGKTGKSVNWSADVSWSQADISDCASNSANGWMSSADKTKLDSITVSAIGTVGANSIVGTADIHVDINNGVATISHANTEITAGTTSGTSNTGNVAFGSTVTLPKLTYDAYGHITATGTYTFKLPAAPTTITGNAGTATKLQSSVNISVGSKTNAFDGSAAISFPTKDLGVIYSDIVPEQTKTYTGIIVSGNSDPAGWLYFAKFKPTNNSWLQHPYVKYRVKADIPGLENYAGYGESVVEFNMFADTVLWYQTRNNISSGSYRPYYNHLVYRATKTGITSGYGHLLGLRFQSSYSPTNSTYARNITIEVLETKNCTIEFLDSMILYANAPGTGTTNYAGRTEVDGTTNGFTHSGDRNDVNYQNKEYYASRKAYSVIYRYQLLLTKNNNLMLPVNATSNNVGVSKTLTTESFDPFGEIYFYNSTSTVNANANVGNNTLLRQIMMDLRYSFNVGGYDVDSTLTSREPLYLVCTPQTDGTAKLYSSPLSQTLPNSEDGLIYIYLGTVYEDAKPYRLNLSIHHPIYWYKDGAVKSYFGMADKAEKADSLITKGRKTSMDVDLNSTEYNKKVTFIHADGNTTTNKPPCGNGEVLNLAWDNTGTAKYGAQIAIGTSDNPHMNIRGSNNGTWTDWRVMLDSANYNSYSPTLTGTGASGTWGISISGNAATATTATTANRLAGFSSGGAASTCSWGDQTGTAIYVGATSAGGGIFFRDNNPSSGKVSMGIDGYFYQNEGKYFCLDTNNYSSYALPLTGGTLTGAVTGTTFSATNFSASSYITGNSGNSGTAGGLALYGSSPSTYGLAMRYVSNGGSHGFVNDDYAIYSYMSGTSEHNVNRGWIWKNAYNGNNVASISNEGHAVFSGSVTVGGTSANDSGCRMEFDSTLKCMNFVFV